MQKTLQNLASVSLLFLVVTGGIHISSTFLLLQGVENHTLTLLFHSLDLPFLLSALLYGSAKLSLSMEDIAEKGRSAFFACMGLSSVVLLLALYMNFISSNVQLF